MKISHFFRFLKRLFLRRRLKASIPHVDDSSDTDDSNRRLSVQYIYGVYDDHDQFASIACFPNDESAVHFYVNCHLGSPSFPCSCLYRLAIMNVDTGSIESIDPVSLHDQVISTLERSLKQHDEFRNYFSDYLSSLASHDSDGSVDREEVNNNGKT